MASHLPAIYRRLKTLVFDTLPDTFDIHSNSFYDRWHIGPELDRDIEGALQNGEQFLNAIVVSPGEPLNEDIDAHGAAQQWTLPLDIFFVYARKQGRDLLAVCETWADPLHDALGQRQIRRLNDLTFKDAQGRRTGHVTGFRVSGPPDLDTQPDNDALYGVDLACFRQPVEVELVTILDPEHNRR